SHPSYFRASSPRMTASSSIRLLVVRRKPSLSSLRYGGARSTTPYPPCPGLPCAAPSVYMVILVFTLVRIAVRFVRTCGKDTIKNGASGNPAVVGERCGANDD